MSANLWSTEKDSRYRWLEVKQRFWAGLDEQIVTAAKRLLEEALKDERWVSLGVAEYERGPSVV